MVHIPFFSHDETKTQTQTEKLQQERIFKEATNCASGSIGFIVALGEKLMSDRNKERIEKRFLPLVCNCLEGLPYRVHKCYALILSAAYLVSQFYNYLANNLL